jgi:hypothetical protein
MRPIAALLCLCLLAGAARAEEKQWCTPDGFSLCRLTDSQFGPCQPLTEAAVAGFNLSLEQQQVVRQFKRLVAGPAMAVLKDLALEFGPKRPPIGAGDYTDVWFPDRDDPRARCFVCGLHLRFAKGEFVQLNYGVRRRFMVVWNRVLMTPPPGAH